MVFLYKWHSAKVNLSSEMKVQLLLNNSPDNKCNFLSFLISKTCDSKFFLHFHSSCKYLLVGTRSWLHKWLFFSLQSQQHIKISYIWHSFIVKMSFVIILNKHVFCLYPTTTTIINGLYVVFYMFIRVMIFFLLSIKTDDGLCSSSTSFCNNKTFICLQTRARVRAIKLGVHKKNML